MSMAQQQNDKQCNAEETWRHNRPIAISSLLNIKRRTMRDSLRPEPNCIRYGMDLQLKIIVKWEKNYSIRYHSVPSQEETCLHSACNSSFIILFTPHLLILIHK
jgi:hypothetical protein